MNRLPPVLVLGASGAVGECLLPRLLAEKLDVIAVSRRQPTASHHGLTWIQHDLDAGPVPAQAGVLVSAGPLEFALRQAEILPRLGRVVALSSASVLFKKDSPDQAERETMAGLLEAESALEDLCRERAAPLTVLRPTLIYGGVNANIDVAGEWMDTHRLVPVAGNGLRQPVHADDLARLIMHALSTGPTSAGTWVLGGGETLAYRDFLRRIASARGVNPRLVPMPAPLITAGLRLAHLFGRLRAIRPAMIHRQRQDLVVDDTPAREWLDWRPRPFRP